MDTFVLSSYVVKWVEFHPHPRCTWSWLKDHFAKFCCDINNRIEWTARKVILGILSILLTFGDR